MTARNQRITEWAWIGAALAAAAFAFVALAGGKARGDRVTYERDDGVRYVFRPATGAVRNAPAVAVKVVRGDGTLGEWVADAAPTDSAASVPVAPGPITVITSAWGGPAPLTPGPGDVVVHKGDSAAKLQLALTAHPRVFLERGGVWTGQFSFAQSGTVDRPAGLFATGSASDPPPKLLGTTRTDGTGYALLVSGKALQNVAIVGIELAPANPAAHSRGEGLYCGGSITNLLITVHVHHFNTNLVLEGAHKGQVVVDGTSSHDAAGPADVLFAGQGFYSDRVVTGPIVRNSVFYHNGPLSDDADDPTWNEYRHGNYNQSSSAAVTWDNNLAADNAADGLMLRDGGAVKGSFFYNNGTSLMLPGDGKAMGHATTIPVVDCDVVGGHTYYDGGGHWIAGVAVDTKSHIALSGVRIVARPGQGTPRPPPRDRRPAIVALRDFGKTYPGGCLAFSKTDPHHPDWSSGGQLVSADRVYATKDWPGGLWAGDAALLQNPKGVFLMPPVAGVATDWIEDYCRESAVGWRCASDRTAAGARARLTAELAKQGWR